MKWAICSNYVMIPGNIKTNIKTCQNQIQKLPEPCFFQMDKLEIIKEI